MKEEKLKPSILAAVSLSNYDNKSGSSAEAQPKQEVKQMVIVSFIPFVKQDVKQIVIVSFIPFENHQDSF